MKLTILLYRSIVIPIFYVILLPSRHPM